MGINSMILKGSEVIIFSECLLVPQWSSQIIVQTKYLSLNSTTKVHVNMKNKVNMLKKVLPISITAVIVIWLQVKSLSIPKPNVIG